MKTKEELILEFRLETLKDISDYKHRYERTGFLQLIKQSEEFTTLLEKFISNNDFEDPNYISKISNIFKKHFFFGKKIENFYEDLTHDYLVDFELNTYSPSEELKELIKELIKERV